MSAVESAGGETADSPPSYLIQSVLMPEAEGYATVDVWLHAGHIAAIAPQVTPGQAAEVIDGRNKLLLPGFVNGHTHSSQVWQRGLIRPLPPELWLAEVFDTAPALGVEELYWAALSTGIETLLSGGTCVVDQVLLKRGQELESVAAIAQAYRELGLRALIAPLIMDEPLAAGLPQGRSRSDATTGDSGAILEWMAAIVEQFHRPATGIQIAVGPTGFHRCSDALLVGCATLSDRYQLCRHTHLLETRAQRQLAYEKYGRSAVAHLADLGFLNHRTSLAHGVWLEEPDLDILAETGATVVHNPVSNLRLGSGIAPILKCLQRGVNVAFGCDGAASNDAQDLLEAIKLGMMLQTVTEPDYQRWITPRRAIAMATLGGAKAVNLAAQTGSLTVGKAADLVLYDLSHPSMLPLTDPIQLLVLGRPMQVVDRVWVQGRQVLAQGQFQTVDRQDLYEQLRDRRLQFNLNPRQTLAQIEPHYRQMLLD